MRPTEAHAALRTMVRTLKIIVVALAAGVLVLLAVGAWRHHGPIAHEVPESASFLTWVAVALGLTQPLVFAVVRWALTRQAVLAWSSADVVPFRQKYAPAAIVGAAGTEAGGLLAGVAYLLEGRLIALGAGLFCALFILLSMPTRRGVDNLIDSRP